MKFNWQGVVALVALVGAGVAALAFGAHDAAMLLFGAAVGGAAVPTVARRGQS